MAKRARYDGPHNAVDVLLPDGTYETVENGHQLKADVPAAFRSSLTSQADWTEVDQPTGDDRSDKKDKE